MNLEDPHLFVPVKQDHAPPQHLLARMTQEQRYLLSHIDGQMSLSALSLYLAIPMDQLIEDLKQLLFWKVVRICRIPPNASISLPAVMGMPLQQPQEATKAWTHDQAQHKKSWSQTERALVAVAFQQRTIQEVPILQKQSDHRMDIHSAPWQQSPGVSIDQAGVYPVVEDRIEDQAGVYPVVEDRVEEIGHSPSHDPLEQTKDFPTPITAIHSESLHTPWCRRSIQESLDDLAQWDQQSTPSADDLFDVGTDQAASGSYESVSADVIPIDDAEVYQAISYYDLPTFANEPLLKPSHVPPTPRFAHNTDSSPQQSKPLHKPNESTNPILPTLLGSPPVPPAIPEPIHSSRPPINTPTSQPVALRDRASHHSSASSQSQNFQDAWLNLSDQNMPTSTGRTHISSAESDLPPLSSVLATLPNLPRIPKKK